MPKTRVEFWEEKFDRNVERSRRDVGRLKDLGWSVGVIWECETLDEATVERLLSNLIGGDDDYGFRERVGKQTGEREP